MGYRTEHRVLNAADYGVPQRRRRLILLASKAGLIPFAVPETSRATGARRDRRHARRWEERRRASRPATRPRRLGCAS